MQPFAIIEPIDDEDDCSEEALEYALRNLLSYAVRDLGPDAVRELVEDAIAIEGQGMN